MIWANVTKFGQNFIAPPKFFGLVRLWLYVRLNSSIGDIALSHKWRHVISFIRDWIYARISRPPNLIIVLKVLKSAYMLVYTVVSFEPTTFSLKLTLTPFFELDSTQ